ncbi:MAG: hypothetical protein AAFV53_02400 [Myxococcota bacterium]
MGLLAAPTLAAGADPECDEEVVQLVVDQETADIYRIEETGEMTRVEDDIIVYMGGARTTTVSMDDSHCWEYQYSPPSSAAMDRSDDSLLKIARVTRDDTSREVETRSIRCGFTFEIDSAAARSETTFSIELDISSGTSEVPIPPIIIRPDPDCPPDT